jgi:hypothetical protein
LWIGDSLGPVERACLRSVVAQGHRMALYCYTKPEGVPDGVEVREASVIVSHDMISAPWCARADLYSDWFRYELLARGLGTWVDADIYLLRPLDLERPYLFGYQDSRIINNAVLRVPPDSPILPRLLEPFVKKSLPKWMPRSAYIRLRARQLLTGKFDLTLIPWGTTSPFALTALARKFGVERFADPVETFYPARWQDADWILDPDIGLEDVVGERTVAVHLWNKCISHFKNEPAPKGSFLHRLQLEGR